METLAPSTEREGWVDIGAMVEKVLYPGLASHPRALAAARLAA